jgi:signal transduction histidine kinase
MQDIVWAVNPKNDDLDHLLLRFSEVAQEMLEPKGIMYAFTTSPGLEGLKLSMEYRREIYLIYKEWLNNIIKYSDCSNVSIRFSIKGKIMCLQITDNGKGFDTAAEFTGNGLKNIKERAEAIDGLLLIYSEKQHGAMLELKVPLGKSTKTTGNGRAVYWQKQGSLSATSCSVSINVLLSSCC